VREHPADRIDGDGREHDAIYLDNAATTPVDRAVVEAMASALTHDFGNPSSRHARGREAGELVEQARASIAARLSAQPDQLTFTSGGSEAIALALLGTARLRSQPGHVLISALEHAATLQTALQLEALGHHVERVPPVAGHREKGGVIDPARVMERVRDDTFLVGVMHVNNETGMIQPVAEIGAQLEQRDGCRFFVDAVQSFTKLPVSLDELRADLVALSAHKIHGPKGVGALLRRADLALAPLWGGGPQERQLRPGTENVAGIVGFARAVELAQGDAERMRARTDRLVAAFCRSHPLAFAVGDPGCRAPHIAAVALPRLRIEKVVDGLDRLGVQVSTGSACHARLQQRSEVMRSMGLGHGVIRLSLSRATSDADVAEATKRIEAALAQLRAPPRV
jgi:cysteine desulfurase